MTTRISLTKEETHPLKGKVDKCQVKESKLVKEEENSIWAKRLMTMPNFTIFVVLIAFGSIFGESLLHSRKHDTTLTTSPDQLDILLDEKATVIYKYTKDLKDSFKLSLNSSSGLNINTNTLTFTQSSKSNNVSVSASRVTSRAFIDIFSCTILSNGSACPFEVSDIFVTVTVSHSRFIAILVQITGWIYFFAWSISFYPQIILNFQRRSVEGLNFDFLVLNIIGFFCYSVYNVLMYFDSEVQDLYIQQDPRAQIPVLLNDVVFALHALFACIITGIQCFFYERGSQRVSYICMGWSTILVLFAGGSFIATLFKGLNWFRFIYFLSYVKMAVTCSKYFPQAILNFRRKSTVGWSIGNVLLDFTGGSMDIVQMVLQGFNTNDWTAFYGNPVKFGLGLVSMVFDILFIIQHYVLYRHSESYEISHDANESTETIVHDPTPNEESSALGDQSQQNYH